MNKQNEKSLLRKKMKSLIREYLSKRKNAKVENCLVKIQELREFNDADVILSYVPLPSEADCSEITDFCLDANKIVAVPKVIAGTSDMNFFILVKNIPLHQQLEKGSFGIYEPKVGLQQIVFSELKGKRVFVLVPGLAFSKSLCRLGKGMGFYDRFIERLFETADEVTLCGFCFSCQVCNEVPTDEHDKSMDYILTETGIIKPEL